MRHQATNFINTWIAVELLADAPSGETQEQVYSRFRREAAMAGLELAEINRLLLDPDLPRVVKKHGDITTGS